MTNPHHFDDAMRQAIHAAMQFRGHVEPNPMVGCTLLSARGEVLAVGAHQRFGMPHAEPNAIALARAAGHDLVGSTAVVTLEPCCHTHKRTPPCVPVLLSAGVARVVVGAVDPNPSVNGAGLQQLRDAGVDVVSGVLEAECRQLLAPFIAATVHRRPYVTIKWAQTADGLVAGPGGARVAITAAPANAVVHQLRSRCDAVAVGATTVLHDDPLLTARAPDPPRKQVSVVFSRSTAIDENAKLVAHPDRNPLIVYTAPLVEALADLHARGVTHLLVEAGPRLAAAFFSANLADRLWTFRSPDALAAGVPAPPLPAWFQLTGHRMIGRDQLCEYLNTRSAVFATAVPSADFASVARASRT